MKERTGQLIAVGGLILGGIVGIIGGLLIVVHGG